MFNVQRFVYKIIKQGNFGEMWGGTKKKRQKPTSLECTCWRVSLSQHSLFTSKLESSVGLRSCKDTDPFQSVSSLELDGAKSKWQTKKATSHILNNHIRPTLFQVLGGFCCFCRLNDEPGRLSRSSSALLFSLFWIFFISRWTWALGFLH